MIKHTEVMKLALEALTKNSDRVTEIRAKDQAITALREALAEQCVCGEPDTAGTHRTDGPCLAEQPAPATELREQEPVAWVYSEGLEALKNGKPWTAYGTKQEANNIALYLHPTPECEPYAWVTFTPYGDEDDVWYENPEGQLLEGWTYKPLYDTAPPRREWVGLTDEDIKEAEWLLSAIKEHEAYTLQEQLLVEGVDVFARAIEAKLREKNGITKEQT